MTTRGQKRSNDAIMSNTSERGTIINMLTGEQTEKRREDETLIGPVKTEDVSGIRDDGPAIAKGQVTKELRGTDPATAKDPG